MPSLTYRKATHGDVPALKQLIEQVTLGVSSRNYDSEQCKAALAWVFGVDTSIIEDGTYYVACDGNRIAACGGWSKRARPFGGDASETGENTLLDPACEAAKIRAFFVHPDYLRQGIGLHLLKISEEAARSEGFVRFTMTATLSGERFYTAAGYNVVEYISLKRDGYADFPAVLLSK